MEPRLLRRSFFTRLGQGLHVVWPILSLLLGVIAGLGAAVAVLEGWPLANGIYFAFVTSLTIGYGDIVPQRGLSRALAMIIGMTGVLVIGLVTAVAVRALEHSREERQVDDASISKHNDERSPER
jgi:voltage-gated potassium channel Kch